MAGGHAIAALAVPRDDGDGVRLNAQVLARPFKPLGRLRGCVLVGVTNG